MGGTGNNGLEPAGQSGTAAALSGSTSAPGWAAPAPTAPAADALASPPAELRPYEQVAAANPITSGAPQPPPPNLGFPSSTAPMGSGFNHAPYPTTAAPGNIHAAQPAASAAEGGGAAAGPAEDPNARVAVYIPAGGFGFGTAGGTFGSTSQNTYQQQAGPDGVSRAISNPYGISVEGVASADAPWQQRGAQELSWLDPVSYQQNTTLKESGLQPAPMTYKPGDVVAKGTSNVPTMSKALYDWNMKVYGNPYGAGYNQQYIGGPTPTPLQSGGQ